MSQAIFLNPNVPEHYCRKIRDEDNRQSTYDLPSLERLAILKGVDVDSIYLEIEHQKYLSKKAAQTGRRSRNKSASRPIQYIPVYHFNNAQLFYATAGGFLVSTPAGTSTFDTLGPALSALAIG